MFLENSEGQVKIILLAAFIMFIVAFRNISASINLLSAQDPSIQNSGSDGSYPLDSMFNVTARTSQGMLDLRFPHSVPDATLNIYGQTTGGPVHVTLPTSFEGTYSIWAPSKESVLVRMDVPDPTGHSGMRQHWQSESPGQLLEGGVSWGSNSTGGDAHNSVVKLRTLASDVSLVL
jgi:hypothetical protein